MNEKHKRFCEEYVIDNNGTQAAIRIGYSEKRAKVTASELLDRQDVKEYIDTLRKGLSEKSGLNAEWVLNRFKQISDRCIQAEPVLVFDPGSGTYIESGEYKFDSSGANKATEMIGKHIGFFKEDNKQKGEGVGEILEVVFKNMSGANTSK
jgi:phage terminase small subunit